MHLRALADNPAVERAALAAASILFGILCVLPHAWQRVDPAYPFRGIEMMGTDQEYYASRIREVMDGNLFIGDLYYADLKADPFVQPPLPEWLQGGMGVLLGLRIGHTVVLSKFLFGALLFAAVALFAGRLFGSRWTGLLGAAAALPAWFLFSSPWVLASALAGEPVAESVARFSRLTNPQVSIIPFFLALWTFMRWRETGRTRDMVWTGLLTGVSFYAYYYTWTMLGATFAVLTFHAALRRDTRTLRAMALLLGVIAVVALPYLLHLRETLLHPGYADLARRIGVVVTHRPLFGAWALLLLALGAVAGKPLSGRHRPLFAALGAAAFLALNQQVFTGQMLVPQHYHWYFIHPLGILAAMACMAAVAVRVARATRTQRLVPFAFVLALGCFAYWGTVFQAHAYAAQRDVWGARQAWAGILRALDRPEFAGVSVYAPDQLADNIAVYTPADVTYAVNTSNCCLTPASRLQDVYFLELWLRGVTPDDAARTFPRERRDEVSRRLFGIYHRERTGAYAGVPDADIDAAAAAYRAYAALDTCAKLTRQPFDLLAWPADAAVPPRVATLQRGATLLYRDAAYALWDVRGLCPRQPAEGRRP